MNLLNIIKKNAKLYISLLVIILLGTLGISFALITLGAVNINVNTTAMSIDANISYDTEGNGSEIISDKEMLPISDELVTGPDVTDVRVLKASFNVSGVSSNPANTIYDIALRDIDIDCELRTKELKWRLYKGTSLLNEGTLSPTFDAMDNNRMVLTKTQEDLTTNVDSYTFLLWISESCTGDITKCNSSMDQSKYLNRTLKASLKVELATGSKKKLVRPTGSEESCSYAEVEIPVCNTLTYNGSVQTLVNSGSNYTLENTTGTEAGIYAITAKVDDGYKWSSGETDDKVLKCSIDKKNVTITTVDQDISYGETISSTVNYVSVSGLLSGDRLESVSLRSNIVEGGEGIISINNVKIVDSNGNDVTYNYKIFNNNVGKVIISYITYTVTLDNQGASSAGTTTLYGRYNNGLYLDSSYSNRMSSVENKIIIPAIMGYTFNGYYTGTDGSGTQLIDSNGYKLSNFSTSLYNSNVTLYADWSINTYNVCFNANGGTGAPECVVKTYGETLILPSTMPTLGEEYNFVGWSTDKNASTATYVEGSEYNVNASATLYAIYEKVTPLSDFTYFLGSEYPVVEVVPFDEYNNGVVDNVLLSPISLQENDVLVVDYIGNSKEVVVPNTYVIDNKRYNTILLSAYYTDESKAGIIVELGVFKNSESIVNVEFGQNIQFIYSAYNVDPIIDDSGENNFLGYETYHKLENRMDYTFSGCTSLVNAPVIPSSVTSMDSTFRGCTSLVNAPVIPNSVIYMRGTFSGCTSLVNAPVIPSSVTSMDSTFRGCTSLVNAPVIPNSVIYMRGTFSGCTSLVNAPVIPNSVTDMSYTFENCTSLVNAPEIPNSVTDMSYTFENCTSLVNAPEIPNSVTYMRGTFSNCTSLSGKVKINSNNVNRIANIFYNTSKDIVVEVPAGSTTYDTISSISLPSNVTLSTFTAS